MRQYLDLLHDVLSNGVEKEDRTGTGTLSVFGRMVDFDLELGFPLLTTKKLHVRSILHELLWFLGLHMKDERYKDLPVTNIKYLRDNGVTIWDEWADEDGNLGKVYGHQWRQWASSRGRTIDQIKNIISELRRFPDSRRILLSSWNVGELDEMKLAPCHYSFQCYSIPMNTDERKEKFKLWAAVNNVGIQGRVTVKEMDKRKFPKRKLELMWNQRSADLFLGLPFNIASYAYLTHIIANATGHFASRLVGVIGDAHIYKNHISYVREQLTRAPRELPSMKVRIRRNIDDVRFDDFKLLSYNPYPNWKNVPIAV